MDRKILPAQRVPVQPPAEAAKRALYKDFPWRQGEFRDFFGWISCENRFGNDSNVGTPLPIGANSPGFQPRLGDDNPPAFRHCDKMFEDNRRQPGEWFFGIADGAVFIGIGIFHQYRAGAIRAQTRAHVPVALPQALVIVANLRP